MHPLQKRTSKVHPDHMPTSRAEAEEWGYARYLGVVPCPMHTPTIRRTSNGACVECDKARSQASRDKRREAERERQRAWKRANPDKHAASKARYRERHSERLAREARERKAARREATAPERALIKAQRDAAKRAERERIESERRAREAELDAMRYAARMIAHTLSDDDAVFRLTQLRNRVKRGKHRAIKFGRKHSLRAHELAAIGDSQGWRCAHCGDAKDLELDHIKPLSIGGHHIASNVQWLCRFHNRDKRDMSDREYRIFRGIPLSTEWDAR